MAAVSVSTTPVTLDAGTAAELLIRNTGSFRALLSNPAEYIRAGQTIRVQPGGLPVTATSNSGTTLDVTVIGPPFTPGTGGGTGAADASRAVPRGSLTTIKTALANQATRPARILFIGDSQTEGTGVTDPLLSWPALFAKKLRQASPGVAGNAKTSILGWRPIISDTGTTVVLPWTVAGTLAKGAGLSIRRGPAVNLTTTSTSITGTVTGTSIDVWWSQGSATGTFTVTVDGTLAATLGATSASTTSGFKANVPLGASGSHTVVIARGSADSFIEGVEVYDGNESSGIRTVNAGKHGTRLTTDWTAGTTDQYFRQGISSFAPDLIVMTLGANDQQFNAGEFAFINAAETMVQWFRQAATQTATPSFPSIVLATTWPRSDVAGSWDPYRYGMSVAANRLGVASYSWADDAALTPGPSGNVGANFVDQVHASAAGQERQAQDFYDWLVTKALPVAS